MTSALSPVIDARWHRGFAGHVLQRELMDWAMLAPTRAAERRARIRRHEGDELPTAAVLTTAEHVWETLYKAQMARAWLRHFGMVQPRAGDDAPALASLR
ncbi:MAG: hypothetical protein WKG00_27875 [Polyangiaceae bacterium]